MRSLLAGALAAVVALAACGSSASPAANPSVPALLSPSTPSLPTAAVPTPNPSPETPRPSIVIPHDDPALEALLPDEVEGTKLLKLSVSPISTAGAAGAQGMKALAERIGDGSGSFGLAYAGDPAGDFNLFALHIPGADGSALLTQFAQMTLAETMGGSVEAATLGGRDVVHVVDPVSDVGDVWFYAEDDLLLGVQAGSATHAEELLALLQG
jgi:hypothetical protein